MAGILFATTERTRNQTNYLSFLTDQIRGSDFAATARECQEPRMVGWPTPGVRQGRSTSGNRRKVRRLMLSRQIRARIALVCASSPRSRDFRVTNDLHSPNLV